MTPHNNHLLTESRKVCLIYSSGGHYSEIKKALEGISFTNHYHVTFKVSSIRFEVDLVDKRYLITHPRRNILRTIYNSIESLIILIKERPDFIISTGADVAIPTIVLGKLLFRSKIIFIESAGDISPTLSGKIAYPFSDLFIVPYKEKLSHFPKAILSKGILL